MVIDPKMLMHDQSRKTSTAAIKKLVHSNDEEQDTSDAVPQIRLPNVFPTAVISPKNQEKKVELKKKLSILSQKAMIDVETAHDQKTITNTNISPMILSPVYKKKQPAVLNKYSKSILDQIVNGPAPGDSFPAVMNANRTP